MFSSDSPVCDPSPLVGIHAAVTRQRVDGSPPGGWYPDSRVTTAEALKAYTVNNAFAAFEDDIRGCIKKGMLADIAVCDLNLMECDPEEVLNMNVLMTIVDGKVVFEK